MNVKTYILHCKTLTERLNFIQNQLDKHNFSNVEWFTKYDANELTEEDLKNFYVNNNLINPNKIKVRFFTKLRTQIYVKGGVWGMEPNRN